MARRSFARREHLGVAARKHVAMVEFLAGREIPELRANMPALPVKRAPRTTSTKPPHASEHQEQSAVIKWWWHACAGYGLPNFALFAIPNGGARDAITGSLLKAEGVRPGSPDLMLAKPADQFHGMFIEMKVGNNKLTDEQQAFATYLRTAGYHVSTHWSAGSAIEAIKAYLA